MRRYLLASAMALVLVGCDDSDTAQMMIGVQGNTELLRPALAVTVTGRGFARTWLGSDITSEGAPNHAPVVETPRSGTLTITATVTSGNDTTQAELDLDARLDWRWGVEILLSGLNPRETCMGCLGVKAFAVPAVLQRSERDSLYLVWGGNSISHPVTY